MSDITTTMWIQMDLPGQVMPVCPVCDACATIITSELCKGQSGEMLCHDCFQRLDLATCAACGASKRSGDLIEHPDGGAWCVNCIEAVCFQCECCGRFAKNDTCNRVQNGANWHVGRLDTHFLCDWCADDETCVCDDCGARVYNEYARVAGVGNSNRICHSCHCDNYVTCEECDDSVHLNNACGGGDDIWYCCDCYPYSINFEPLVCSDASGTLEIGSERQYGIELETDECRGYASLRNTFWGAKNDCTVQGKEFYSTILSGDAGLKAIRDWGKLADANNWRAGCYAGYHLHLDLGDESDNSKYAIAYAYRKTQEVWFSFVNADRQNGGYCHNIRWSCTDIDLAIDAGTRYWRFADSGTRYNWCNVTAIEVHNTIEIRLHHGTCDDVAVINWVKAHVRFADWASAAGMTGVRKRLDGLGDDELFRFIGQEIWKDSELFSYYTERAKRYNHSCLGENSDTND